MKHRALKGIALTMFLTGGTITGRQALQQRDQDNLLLGATGQALGVCAESMVANATHTIMFDNFLKCAPQSITLPNGVKATIAFEDNIRSTDGSGRYSVYEHEPHATQVTVPYNAEVSATTTIDGQKTPTAMAETYFRDPTNWKKTTLEAWFNKSAYDR